MQILISAVLYFLIVFGVGFALGPIRVFWLEPALGQTIAVLCETPFLLAAMVLAASWVPAKLNLTRRPAPLLAMGIGALLLQQIADFTVGSSLRGLSAKDQIAYFATPAGMIYAVALLLFALMPLLVARAAARPKDNP
jgi:hypothetical protein